MNPITMNLVADDIIRFALREDMNAGDLSTESVCPERREAEVQLIAKAEGVIAGCMKRMIRTPLVRLVDDDDAFRESQREFLKAMGWQVEDLSLIHILRFGRQ